MKLAADKNGIKYKNISYVPGSEVRARRAAAGQRQGVDPRFHEPQDRSWSAAPRQVRRAADRQASAPRTTRSSRAPTSREQRRRPSTRSSRACCRPCARSAPTRQSSPSCARNTSSCRTCRSSSRTTSCPTSRKRSAAKSISAERRQPRGGEERPQLLQPRRPDHGRPRQPQGRGFLGVRSARPRQGEARHVTGRRHGRHRPARRGGLGRARARAGIRLKGASAWRCWRLALARPVLRSLGDRRAHSDQPRLPALQRHPRRLRPDGRRRLPAARLLLTLQPLVDRRRRVGGARHRIGVADRPAADGRNGWSRRSSSCCRRRRSRR